MKISLIVFLKKKEVYGKRSRQEEGSEETKEG